MVPLLSMAAQPTAAQETTLVAAQRPELTRRSSRIAARAARTTDATHAGQRSSLRVLSSESYDAGDLDCVSSSLQSLASFDDLLSPRVLPVS